MENEAQSARSSFDFKKLLSGGVYIVTLGLVIIFILTSLSDLVEGL
jgi:hypothetical protein